MQDTNNKPSAHVLLLLTTYRTEVLHRAIAQRVIAIATATLHDYYCIIVKSYDRFID
jgi:hypothetical protein